MTPIVWILGLDITTSVGKDRFVVMRDQMIPHAVLSRLHSRDVVHVMPVNSDPERSVHVTRLVRKVSLDKEIASIVEYIQTRIKYSENPKVMTNIGGILAYAKRLSHMLQEERQRTAASGASLPPAPRFVVVIFTDGKPEGVQTKPLQGSWPVELMVWFWGIEGAYEASLKKWATTEMGLPEGQLHIVRFTDWQTAAEQVFGPRINRPYPNMEVLNRLGIGRAIARR
jgi:hypothetical protein